MEHFCLHLSVKVTAFCQSDMTERLWKDPQHSRDIFRLLHEREQQ